MVLALDIAAEWKNECSFRMKFTLLCKLESRGQLISKVLSCAKEEHHSLLKSTLLLYEKCQQQGALLFFFQLHSNQILICPENVFMTFDSLAGLALQVCPNISTTPIMAMRCRQCLPLSIVHLKGKHCRKPHCRNGVVDTFGHGVPNMLP